MKLLYTLIIFLNGISAGAQTIIKGKVSDERGEPITGANVLIQDSYDGTSSSGNGTFSFTTDEKGQRVMQITFVGYKIFTQSV